ncbi:hypothetical protein DSOL_4317 [Desulfosporosinus metallidurans]|uniref:Uncharacterized protein n=1 Tax=Desulfosporosinus metallidurans TaxID=1888891 RepID=A0A1Q8QL20_9FIRM|nr:hypothetical protein DSOL_4317 [Desulfosporosinus metallidurans]
MFSNTRKHFLQEVELVRDKGVYLNKVGFIDIVFHFRGA